MAQKNNNNNQTDECWENAGTPECWTTEIALGKSRVETVATGIVDAREFEENADRYAAHFVSFSISWQFPPALFNPKPSHSPLYYSASRTDPAQAGPAAGGLGHSIRPPAVVAR